MTERELREVFCRNLAKLIAGRGSISEICEETGINRTQFSRYLSGDSIPRATIVFQLAKYFNVSSDAFFCDDISEYAASHTYANLVQEQMSGRNIELSSTSLPVGFYRVWRGSFFDENRIAGTMCLVKDYSGIRVVGTNTCRNAKKLGNWPIEYPADRYCRGIAISSGGGIHIQFADFRDVTVMSTFLMRVPGVAPRGSDLIARYIGYAAVSQPMAEAQTVFVPALFEQVKGTTASVLKAARTTKIGTRADTEPEVLRYLDMLDIPRVPFPMVPMP